MVGRAGINWQIIIAPASGRPHLQVAEASLAVTALTDTIQDLGESPKLNYGVEPRQMTPLAGHFIKITISNAYNLEPFCRI